MKQLTFLIIILNSLFVEGQYTFDIARIDSNYQKHLNSGIDMLGCSRNYYLQMDSVLNVVYKRLRSALDDNQKLDLKKEQLDWLKQRDKYFEEQNKIFQDKFNSGEWGNDMAMITYDNEAKYVKKRIIELIRRIRK